MKIQVARQDLSAACQLAMEAIPQKDVIPILSNFCVELGEGRVYIHSSDSEVWCRVGCNAITTGDGVCLLPARMLNDCLKASRDETVEIMIGEKAASLSGDSTDFVLPLTDPVGYPTAPVPPNDSHHLIDAATLAAMIRRTQFAVAVKSTRPAMNGFLWETDGSKTVMVGSDTSQMAIAMADAEAVNGHSTGKQRPVLPARVMQMVGRAAKRLPEGAKVKVTFTPNVVHVFGDDFSIIGRLIEGKYSPYELVAQSPPPNSCRVVAGDLLHGFKQVAVVLDELHFRCWVTFKMNEIQMESEGSIGRARARVKMTGYSGPPMRVPIEPMPPLQMLGQASATKELECRFGDHEDNIFLIEDGYTYCLSPLAEAGPVPAPPPVAATAGAAV